MAEDGADTEAVERRIGEAGEERKRKAEERAEAEAARRDDRSERRAGGGGGSGGNASPFGRGLKLGGGSGKEFEQVGLGLLAGGALLWFLSKRNDRPGMSDNLIENPAQRHIQETEPGPEPGEAPVITDPSIYVKSAIGPNDYWRGAIGYEGREVPRIG